jgi:hypothetical protein
MSSAKQHYEDQQREAHYRLLHSFNWLSKRANYALQIMTVNDQARMEMAASIFRPDDPESGHRSRLRLSFYRSESSHRTDPSPVSFTLVHVIPRRGHAVHLPRELRLKNHQTAVAECQLARGEVKFPHAAKPLIGKATFLSVTLYEALTPTTKRFRIVQAQDFHVGDNQARTLDDWRNL